MNAAEVVLAGKDHMLRLSSLLAAQAQAGDTITLSGEVGTGKTTFAQGFIGALLKSPQSITSPTFTLVQSYETKHPWRAVHADLYRLRDASELAELGLEEAFYEHVVLVEWPEMARAILPADSLHVELSYLSEHERKMTLSSQSPRWRQRISDIL